jgi:hypothetical protein
MLKENRQNARWFGGSGADPNAGESAGMQMLDIDHGILPEI